MVSSRTDLFRRKYRPLTDEERKAMDAVKAAADELQEAIEAHCKNLRYQVTAITDLEKVVVMACKGITA